MNQERNPTSKEILRDMIDNVECDDQGYIQREAFQNVLMDIPVALAVGEITSLDAVSLLRRLHLKATEL